MGEGNPVAEAIVAIDGSKFKAVNNRAKHFTANKLNKRVRRVTVANPGAESFRAPCRSRAC